MNDRVPIDAPGAPAAIGPYAHAVASGARTLYVSGQLPLDPGSGELVGGTPAEQAEQVLRNLRAVVEAAGATLADVLKTTVYLTDMAAFVDVNETYARHFPSEPPARVAVAVTALPRSAQVEIDAIVALPDR